MKQYVQKFEAKQTSEARQLASVSKLHQFMSLMLIMSLLVAFNFAWAATPAKISPADAAAVLANEKFDHVKTGFNLTGAHATARCVTCHINNVLKGTPRECASCHIAGNRMSAIAKPTSNHLITNEPCGTCHKTSLWSPAFFSHVGVATGTCKTCHNGSQASGLPRGHTSTNSSCDSCHKTTDWLQAAFSHKGIVNGCSTCHGQTFQGSTPTPKPAKHMVTSADCSDCHITTSFVTLKPGANIPLPSGHFPTTQTCGACHRGASFIPGIMNHVGITGNCEQCHGSTISWLGVTTRSKPGGHMVTSLQCATCHTSTSTFTLNANAILPMPAGHLPSLKPCSTCHSTYGPGSGVMNHIGINTGCASCHTGQSFPVGQGVSPLPKPPTSSHIPSTTPCELCHSPTSTSGGGFFGAVMNHTGITANCSSCHYDNNGYTGAKTKLDFLGHMATTADCSTCHSPSSTQPGGFAGATGGVLPANHVPATEPCSICHTNGYTGGTTLHNHIVIASNCVRCHSDGMSFLGVTPKRKQDAMAQHLTTSQDCSFCHTGFNTFFGASPNAKPANHLPTIQTCASCHTNGYTGGTTMNGHVGITGNCIQCHNGQTFAVGMRPVSKLNFSTHPPTTLDCSNCHTGFTTFSGATGGTLPNNHLPTNQPCSVCHAAGFGPNSGVMNHIGIVSGCTSCHNGQTFAVGMRPTAKASNHVPTSLSCETCHSSSSTSPGGFSGATMSHTGITSGCALCHGGAAFQGVTPLSKASNHLPTSGACEICHSRNSTSPGGFGGAPMNHTGITTGCVLCHNGTTFQGGVRPVSKPGNHIPYALHLLGGSAMGCEFCHTSTNSFSPMNASSTKMHNGSRGKGAGSGYCAGCHLSGTNFLGVRGRKSLNHEAGGTQIDCSKSGCHRPLGNTGSTYNAWD